MKRRQIAHILHQKLKKRENCMLVHLSSSKYTVSTLPRVPAQFGAKTLKNDDASSPCKWGARDLPEGHKREKTLVKTLVVLIRNTTWRCGKLEKSIVKHLHKKHENLGKKEVYVNDIMQNLNFTGEKKNEFLDALKRLEKRNIVRLLP